jgi:transcriptional regulator with XRE-family HTH domain
MESGELASSLRTWRDRLRPEDVGLGEPGGQRRAPGLRREEVAHLAGLSVDYLARLEQGRATSPSPSVLGPLARALRLTEDERAHLFLVAGQAEPGGRRIGRHLTPGLQRIMDRLVDVPVMVLDAGWTVVATNALGTALMGNYSGRPARERNIAWLTFVGEPSRVAYTPEQQAAFEADVVADLHAAVGRYAEDEGLRELVADLRAASPRFAELWAKGPIEVRVSSRKTIMHPEVGPITIDCDVLRASDSDLRLVVYTAEPNSTGTQAIALLGALGLQSFAAVE